MTGRLTPYAFSLLLAAMWLAGCDSAQPGAITVLQPLEGMTVIVGEEPIRVDLAAYFRQTEGRPLTFSASTPSPVLDVAIEGATLVLDPLETGEAEVTLGIADDAGHVMTAAFHVSAVAAANPCVPGADTGEADYFPVEEGAVWTFDYEGHGSNGGQIELWVWWSESGTLTLSFTDVTCLDDPAQGVYTLEAAWEGVRSFTHELGWPLPDEPVHEERTFTLTESAERELHLPFELFLSSGVETNPFARYHPVSSPDTLDVEVFRTPPAPNEIAYDIEVTRGRGLTGIRQSYSQLHGGSAGYTAVRRAE